MSRVINYRLPHYFKNIGLIGAALVMFFLVGYKFYGANELLVKDVCRYLMLLLLLIATMCKDTIEDEYFEHIRYQSYVLSFICAATYAVVLPLFTLIVNLLITAVTDDGHIKFYEISAFEVIFILVCFQLLIFSTLKRLGRAE